MQTELTILACFIAGLSSTLHCFGMCGGISTMLSLQSEQSEQYLRKYQNAFLYNAGRIFSYAMIGLLAGISSQFATYHFLKNGHQILQIISSIILITIALHILGLFSSFKIIEKVAYILWKKVQLLFKWLLPAKSPIAVFSFGLIWGWLPCGMVYSVLLLAVSSANALDSMLYMLAFGLGTLPGMFSASAGSSYINGLTKKAMFKYISAVLLIGIALIPFYSSFFSDNDHSNHSYLHHHH